MAESKPNMFEYRWDQFTKAGDKDASDPRRYLRGAGAAAGLFGDILAAPFEALTPQFVSDALTEGADYLVNETYAGKAVVEFAKENPEYAKDILDVMNIAGAVPALKILSKAGTAGIKAALGTRSGVLSSAQKGVGEAIGSSSMSMAVARNMPTLQQGGMFGDVLDAVRTVKGTGDNLRTYSEIASGTGRNPRTGIGFYTGGKIPKAVATLGEAVRSAPRAISELTSPKALASYRETGMSLNARKRELPNADTPLEFSGTHAMQAQMKKQNDGINAPLNDINSPLMIKARLAEYDLLDNTSVPDINKTMFKGIPEDIATRHLSHIKAVHGIDGSKPAVLSIKPPKTNGIARELLGTGSTGDPFIKGLTQGDLLDVYKKAYGVKKVDGKGMVELTQIGVGLNSDVYKNLLRRLGSDGKGNYSKPNVIKNVITARAKESKGVPLGKLEKKILNAWEKSGNLATVKDASGKTVSGKRVSDMDDIIGDTLTTSGSYLSKSKELGGVNYVMTHSLKKNKSYVTMSDGSDLFGIGGGPKNAPSIVVATPTQEIIHGSKRTVTLEDGKKLPQRFDNKRTQQVRKNEKKDLAKGIKELEERSGIKKKSGETPENYHKRILRDYEAKPELRDYKQAAANIVKIGTIGSQSDMRNSGLFGEQ
jgi:hypothetical protein